MAKPYTSKSLPSAIREVRALRQLRGMLDGLLERFDKDRKALAKLAAEGPCFSNPLEVYEVKKLRDELLKAQGLAPDGTFLNKQATPQAAGEGKQT